MSSLNNNLFSNPALHFLLSSLPFISTNIFLSCSLSEPPLSLFPPLCASSFPSFAYFLFSASLFSFIVFASPLLVSSFVSNNSIPHPLSPFPVSSLPLFPSLVSFPLTQPHRLRGASWRSICRLRAPDTTRPTHSSGTSQTGKNINNNYMSIVKHVNVCFSSAMVLGFVFGFFSNTQK